MLVDSEFSSVLHLLRLSICLQEKLLKHPSTFEGTVASITTQIRLYTLLDQRCFNLKITPAIVETSQRDTPSEHLLLPDMLLNQRDRVAGIIKQVSLQLLKSYLN